MSTASIQWNSGIIRKTIIAFTGLFLVLFLMGHLAGNLQLFMGEVGREQFNAYGHFMTSNPIVKLLSYVTYLSIVLHVVYSIMLTLKNKKARSISYTVKAGKANSAWSSRNMALLGVFTLLFIIIHLRSFWFEMHWGEIPLDASGNKDLYEIVFVAFQQWWYVLLYVICMVLLAFHLSHGFQSAFQSLGLGQKKYAPLIKKIGMAFSIVMPLLFALMPIYIFFQ